MRFTPRSELMVRISKLQQAMSDAGFDGIVIAQNADLFYFAGTVRQSNLYVPASGVPVLMVRKSLDRAREESNLGEIVPLSNLKEMPNVLASYGYRNLGVLGFEMDVLPVALFMRYQKILPSARLADASELIKRVKMVKSAYEINLMKEAAKINQVIFSRVRDYLREGITEIELAGKLELLSRQMGNQGYIRMRGFNQEMAFYVISGPNLAEPSYLDTPISGTGLNVSLPQGAGYRKIQVNEPVMLDYGGAFDGYIVDQTRTYCIGRLPEKMTRAYETAISIQEELKQKAVPGVLCKDLYALAVDIANQADLGNHFMGYSDAVHFVGHGVGIELDEWPVLAKRFNIPLEEGMVMAIEPKFVFPEGAVGIENTFVVRNNGLETITEFDEGIIYL
ncbi:M24 family metallopeptidase [Desulfoscipio gibsoniae]|uniref:Xaa-Pro aminopeptidase n=1 Tax=Desulfoscipio gibsoniae DSM 7213 TaxID=767817 RepID=R4KGZ2_9FIRM|nr:Xaa-Pro peptidase family protein [Desulfoscipio gibsoniae]AGL00922.1 Xaa-Pro aminopeptidase [Desulfoscipio gibsoniae DSM 7213]